jgi:hypothetical protein
MPDSLSASQLPRQCMHSFGSGFLRNTTEPNVGDMSALLRLAGFWTGQAVFHFVKLLKKKSCFLLLGRIF